MKIIYEHPRSGSLITRGLRFRKLFASAGISPELFASSGISPIRSESFGQVTRAPAHGVNNLEGLEDDQIQTSCSSRDFVIGGRNPWNCTASRPRTGRTGFLPELGR